LTDSDAEKSATSLKRRGLEQRVDADVAAHRERAEAEVDLDFAPNCTVLEVIARYPRPHAGRRTC
jgi:hypothetical protein